MVITGGGDGIMRACQEGAGRQRSFGANIRLPFEQEPNEFISNDPKLVTFRYFFIRKVMLVKYSCAFIVMPGGLGTLDELFEAATLVQCGKIGPFPVILMGKSFWDGMRRWGQFMMKQGVFTQEEISFGYVTDSPAEAVDVIRRSLTPEVCCRLVPLAAPRKTGRRSK